MIDGMLLDKLEEIGRIVRGSEEPFGGLQVSSNWHCTASWHDH
jgi:hypothetical protein